MCHKEHTEHKSLFFAVIKNDKIFPSNVFSMITDFFLEDKWGILERVRRYVHKNLLNLDYQDSIPFSIFQVSYK